MGMVYDSDFIREEVRDEWPVSETTKKVWWIQMDLLKVFDAICKKYDLRWYPDGGVLIGVIRHKGFIPWDDDVDVCMPREDYDKFLEICPKEISYPYFLQTPLTDNDCYMYWSSLRNSDTTGNRESCMSTRQNNGIAIDIIPMEGCENSYFLYKMRRQPLRIASVICNTYVNEFNMSKSAVTLRKILRKMKINYRKIYKRLEKHNSKHPMSKYEKCTQTLIADPMVYGKGGLKRVIQYKEDYATTIDMPFENMTLPVPCGYDRILTNYYGDYMAFPPLDKRQGKHDMVFEPDVPYKEYCSKNYGVKYED